MKTCKLNKLELKVYHESLKTIEPIKEVDLTDADNFAVGSYVVVRTYSAGVHYGLVSAISENRVVLTNSRRLRTIVCLDDGDSLSHVAKNGISTDSNITTNIDGILLEWIEVLPVTQNSKNTFDAQPYEVVT